MNPPSKPRLAIIDLVDGLRSVRIWPMLGWQDVRQRYRRSVLGPFWLTISTGVMIGAMGPLYGKLFNQDISGYFAFSRLASCSGSCCLKRSAIRAVPLWRRKASSSRSSSRYPYTSCGSSGRI